MSSKKSVWDAVAARYDAERKDDPVYAICMRQVVADLRARGRVLDAGCGTGMATQYIRAGEIHAVDYSPASVEVLRTKLPGVVAGVADIRELPYPDSHFDAVMCGNTLQHLTPTDQKKAVHELMRVLKPGGTYSVSVHHYSIDKQAKGWTKEGAPGQPGIDYIFRFTRDELLSLLPASRVRAVGFYGERWQRIRTKLFGHKLARSGIGHMLVAYGVRK